MAPCRVTHMSGREVAVGAIGLHGLRMRCNNGNVPASRAWGLRRDVLGGGRKGPCNGRKGRAEGASVRAGSRGVLPRMCRGWGGHGARMADVHVVRWRAQTEDSRAPCRHCAGRPSSNRNGGCRVCAHRTAAAHGRAAAMSRQYKKGVRHPPSNTRSAGFMSERTIAFFTPPCRSQAGHQGCMPRAQRGATDQVKRGAIEETPFPERRPARPRCLHFDCPCIRAG